MQIIEYSPIFGYRGYRLDYIREDMCIKYYDINLHNELSKIEKKLKKLLINKTLNNLKNPLTNKQTQLNTVINTAGNFIEEAVYTNLNKIKFIEVGDWEPNNKNTFPDYTLKILNQWIHFDSKAVLCDEYKTYDTRKFEDPEYIPNYNNGGGNQDEVSKHILNHYNGIDDNYYKAFIIYTFYNRTGDILDIKIVPIIYCLYVSSQNWQLDKIRFNIKSRGTNGEIKNSNITMTLPSFTCKSGMNTFEEQELLVATAVSNYLDYLDKITINN